MEIMELIKILASLKDEIINIGIAIFSFLLGIWLNHYKAKSNFEFDTKKMLITRRLEAYESLYDILKLFLVTGVFNYNEDENIRYYLYLIRNEEVALFKEKEDIVLKDLFWYSKNLEEKVIDFFSTINGVFENYKYTSCDLERYQLWHEKMSEINDLQNDIRKLIYEDLKSLNDINDFLKSGHSQ